MKSAREHITRTSIKFLFYTFIFDTFIAIFLTAIKFGDGFAINFIISQCIGLSICTCMIIAHCFFDNAKPFFKAILVAAALIIGTICGLLYLSSQGAAGDGNVSPEEMSHLFSLQSGQDPDIFARRLLEVHVSIDEPHQQYALFYGTPVRARHSNNFIHTFERLMRRAEEVDPDFIIRDSLLTSSNGLIYRLAKRHQAAAPPELGDPNQTGLHLNF